MAAQQETTVVLGDGVGSSVSDRVPMTMIARRGRDVTYAAVLEPVQAGDEPTIGGIKVTDDGDSRVVVVDRGASEDRIRVSPDGEIVVRVSP
jgi:hypothetical protein